MALHKDEAFLLFKRAYGESDRIMRMFTRSSGKISVIAKGAGKSQKRFMNTLEPFNHIRIEYFEKASSSMARIENADIIETNSGIEKSFKKACLAGFFTEFVDRLTKEKEPNEPLFYTLKEVLNAVKTEEFHYPTILYFQLRMLDLLGYMPNLDTCVYCTNRIANEEKVYFSKERGGILCGNCAKSLPRIICDRGMIPRLISIIKKEDVPIDQSFKRQARDIMEGFVTFHLDVEFRSYRLLKGFLL